MIGANPEAGSAHNALCWGYALDGEPDAALPHCDRALALGLDRSVRDGRGIALAQLGRLDESMAELQVYVDQLRAAPDGQYERGRGPIVEGWIEQLAAGEDPFDEATLDALR